MKSVRMSIIIVLALLSPFIWGQQDLSPDDYMMLATFYEMKEYRTFDVSNQGEITYKSKQQLSAKPYHITCAPNGKWGLVGCSTLYSVLIEIDKERKVHVWDYLPNPYISGETAFYVAISPDSRKGCYRHSLNTVNIINNSNYTVTINSNISLGKFAFLSPCRIIAHTPVIDWWTLSEFSVRNDGVTTPTGVTIDISPSTAQRGICVSPDGKTAIVISGVGADVTVIRVNGDGDFSVVQQFGRYEQPSAVHFSQNSSLVAIRYERFISIYAVSYDSRLTEISRASIPRGVPDGMMAVSYDFKLAVAGYRVLEGGYYKSYFYVFRIHENGMIEYLPDKDYVCLGLYADIAFVPPQVTDAEPAWNMYE